MHLREVPGKRKVRVEPGVLLHHRAAERKVGSMKKVYEEFALWEQEPEILLSGMILFSLCVRSERVKFPYALFNLFRRIAKC